MSILDITDVEADGWISGQLPKSDTDFEGGPPRGDTDASAGPEMPRDGVHLTAAGYARVGEKLPTWLRLTEAE